MIALLLLGQIAAAAPVADPELAEQRGGFRLPNGVDVALTVRTDTAVDGALVLRTVFRADQGAPTLSVQTPRPGMTVAGVVSSGAAETAARAPSVSYDPRSGIQVTPAAATAALRVGTTGADAAPSPDLQTVDASGAGITTDAGAVTQVRAGGIETVQLKGADLTVTHLAGNAFGSAIANSGNDRAIDTQTSVAIDLSNAGPDVVGSAMLRVLDLGSAVSAMRVQ